MDRDIGVNVEDKVIIVGKAVGFKVVRTNVRVTEGVDDDLRTNVILSVDEPTIEEGVNIDTSVLSGDDDSKRIALSGETDGDSVEEDVNISTTIGLLELIVVVDE